MLFSVFKGPHSYQSATKKLEVRKKVDHLIPVVALVVVVGIVVVVAVVEAFPFVVLVVVVVIVEEFPFVVNAMERAMTKIITMTNAINNAIPTGLNHFDWHIEVLLLLLICEKKKRDFTKGKIADSMSLGPLIITQNPFGSLESFKVRDGLFILTLDT